MSPIKPLLLTGTALGAALLQPAAASAQASASPYTSATRYDALRRVTGTISADPDTVGSGNPFLAVRNTYDAQGRLTKVERGTLTAWQAETVAPASWTGFTVHQTIDSTYDAMGRKLSDRLTAGGSVQSLTQTSYDVMGRVRCTVTRLNQAAFATAPSDACAQGTAGSDGADRITRYSYDAGARPVRIETGVGTAERRDQAIYSYTANGQMASLTDANGNRSEMRYDGHDRLTRLVFPSASAAGLVNESDYEGYTLDAASNRTQLRRRDGTQLTYSYDNLNRRTVKAVPERSGLSATHTRDVHYAYDNLNRQTIARFDSLTGEGLSFGYDGLGRVSGATSTMGGVSRTLSYAYTAAGGRERITHPDGTYYLSNYDGLDRLTLLRENGSAWLAGYGHDAQGRLLGRSSNAGAAGNSGYGYDPDGALNHIGHNVAGTSHDYSVTLGRNRAGQIITALQSNDLYAFNRTAQNRTDTHNGLNQIATLGGAAAVHDANGNLTTDPGTGAGSTTYTYDQENRLVAASGARNAGLSYDPLGRLASLTAGATTIWFLHDGDRLVGEYDGGGNAIRRYVHGNTIPAGSAGAADEPLVWDQIGDPTPRRWLHADERGSIVAITNDSGTLIANHNYDEYGNPQSGAILGRFGYTGQMWIPELGMYYYRARMFDPVLPRFLQADPVGYAAGPNLYGYVSGDPINAVDATGMCRTDPDTGNRSGICGSNEDSQSFVDRRLADSASNFSKVEEAAVARGNLITVELVVNSPLANGAATIPGDQPGDSIVSVDVGERIRMDNLDESGNVTDSRLTTPEEAAEHDVVGHAYDAVLNPNAPRGEGLSDESRSIEAENALRRRMDIDFQRSRNIRAVVCNSRGQCSGQ